MSARARFEVAILKIFYVIDPFAAAFARAVDAVFARLVRVPSLREYSPRAWTFAYFLSRIRAVIRHQFALILPAAAAAFCAALMYFYLNEVWDSSSFLWKSFLTYFALAVGFLGGHGAWQTVAARLNPFLDAHPQSQAGIKKGYRMPPKPELSAPFCILGEGHYTRQYTPSGDYSRGYSLAELYSPTPDWVTLPADALATGLLVYGSTGSGKTSYVLAPSIFPMFNHLTRPAGLVMDSKGSLVEPLEACLITGGRAGDLLKIGPRHATFWNPLHQPFSSPNTLADLFLQVLENLNGSKYKADSMWIRHGSRMLLESGIGLLRLSNNRYVTAQLVTYLLSNLMIAVQGKDSPAAASGEWIDSFFVDQAADFSEDAQAEFEFYKGMLQKVFNQDEKFRAIFGSEIENVLSPLCDIAVCKKYNAPLENLDMPDWATIINEGKIIVLDCNQTEYPGLSIVLGMLLKLGYQNAVLSRPEWVKMGRVDAERYMILAIDEYQQFASQSDADYVALCRQSRSISVFLTQGHVSLVDRVGKETTDKLEHSLRNKLILSQPNAADAAALFGKAERERTARSINENIEEAALGATGKFSGKSTVAQSLNISSSEENAVSEEILRNLPLGQGILMSHTGMRIIPPHRVFLRAGFLPDTRYVDTPAANSIVN